MGGHALGFEALRVSADQFSYIVKDFQNWMEENVDCKFELTVIPAYRTKDSFGDADIVISCEAKDWEIIIGTLSKKFVHYKNGKTFSFGWKTNYSETPFQIDLIYTGCAEDDFKVALDYFSYNDCGNLVGRLAHRCGFKYGHAGLIYVLRDPTNKSNVIKEIVVTKNTESIHEFLDLDHEAFKQGFDTLEEMFEWVSSSRYFDPSIYLLDNINAVSRIRDRKRKTYMYFLQWCESLQLNIVTLTRDQVDILRRYKLAQALEHSLEFNLEYTNENYNFSKLILAKQFFNGDLVSEWTGLKGKELGEFMRGVKPSPDFILDNMHEIKGFVLNLVEQNEN